MRVANERGRNSSRFPRAWLRRDDDRARSPKVFDDLADERIDWKRFVRQ